MEILVTTLLPFKCNATAFANKQLYVVSYVTCKWLSTWRNPTPQRHQCSQLFFGC